MFPAASQPDVVLSMDRDGHYALTLLADGASDILESLVGSRRAELLAPEVRLVATALYHGLTTLAGKQTLGQEYCDLALVAQRRSNGCAGRKRPLPGPAQTTTPAASAPPALAAAAAAAARHAANTPVTALPGRMALPELRPMSAAQRGFYVLLHVLLPYLNERSHRGWRDLRDLRDPLAAARARARAAAAGGGGRGGGGGTGDGGANAAAAAAGAANPVLSAAAASITEADTPKDNAAMLRLQRAWNSLLDRFSTLLDRATAAVSRQRQRQQGRERGGRASAAAAAVLLSWPAVLALLAWLKRFHLTVFYFRGAYYTVAMRLAGVRLMSTRIVDDPRARYAVLGLLALLPLAAEAAAAAAAACRVAITACGSGRSGADGDADSAAAATAAAEARAAKDAGRKAAAAAAAVAARVPALAEEEGTLPSSALGSSAMITSRRCSLCMGPRINPTATPCGHLFCWSCVAGWCQTSPECPLCRQAVEPQSLVCVYQYH